jgi:hypothetical protein
MRIDDLIENVRQTAASISVKETKSGDKYRVYELSMTITALGSDIDRLIKEFPGFKFSHIYGSYWLIYFNKAEDWGLLKLPTL